LPKEFALFVDQPMLAKKQKAPRRFSTEVKTERRARFSYDGLPELFS
jgi:hypothetical protein